jgi:hypothetical protein
MRSPDFDPTNGGIPEFNGVPLTGDRTQARVKKITRAEFIRVAGAVAAASALGGCKFLGGEGGAAKADVLPTATSRKTVELGRTFKFTSGGPEVNNGWSSITTPPLTDDILDKLKTTALQEGYTKIYAARNQTNVVYTNGSTQSAFVAVSEMPYDDGRCDASRSQLGAYVCNQAGNGLKTEVWGVQVKIDVTKGRNLGGIALAENEQGEVKMLLWDKSGAVIDRYGVPKTEIGPRERVGTDPITGEKTIIEAEKVIRRFDLTKRAWIEVRDEEQKMAKLGGVVMLGGEFGGAKGEKYDQIELISSDTVDRMRREVAKVYGEDAVLYASTDVGFYRTEDMVVANYVPDLTESGLVVNSVDSRQGLAAIYDKSDYSGKQVVPVRRVAQGNERITATAWVKLPSGEILPVVATENSVVVSSIMGTALSDLNKGCKVESNNEGRVVIIDGWGRTNKIYGENGWEEVDSANSSGIIKNEISAEEIKAIAGEEATYTEMKRGVLPTQTVPSDLKSALDASGVKDIRPIVLIDEDWSLPGNDPGAFVLCDNPKARCDKGQVSFLQYGRAMVDKNSGKGIVITGKLEYFAPVNPNNANDGIYLVVRDPKTGSRAISKIVVYGFEASGFQKVPLTRKGEPEEVIARFRNDQPGHVDLTNLDRYFYPGQPVVVRRKANALKPDAPEVERIYISGSKLG